MGRRGAPAALTGSGPAGGTVCPAPETAATGAAARGSRAPPLAVPAAPAAVAGRGVPAPTRRSVAGAGAAIARPPSAAESSAPLRRRHARRRRRTRARSARRRSASSPSIVAVARSGGAAAVATGTTRVAAASAGAPTAAGAAGTGTPVRDALIGGPACARRPAEPGQEPRAARGSAARSAPRPGAARRLAPRPRRGGWRVSRACAKYSSTRIASPMIAAKPASAPTDDDEVVHRQRERQSTPSLAAVYVGGPGVHDQLAEGRRCASVADAGSPAQPRPLEHQQVDLVERALDPLRIERRRRSARTIFWAGVGCGRSYGLNRSSCELLARAGADDLDRDVALGLEPRQPDHRLAPGRRS